MSGKRFDAELGPQDTFETADFLGRGALAESMYELVNNSTDPLVVALDDQWGSGKTHFLRLWQSMLLEKEIPVVYFNAFESDFSKDAYVALAASLAGALAERQSSGAENRSAFVRKASKFGAIVSRSAVNIGIRALTAGAVDLADVGETIDAAIEQTGEELERSFQNAISKKASFKQDLVDFRESLGEVRRALQSEEGDKPLVMIVDELDRCRPNFALDVLECAKHFFQTERTHFILGTDLKILGESVSSIYGGGMNGTKYLDRFVDYRLSFSPPRFSNRAKVLRQYSMHLWQRCQIFEQHQDVRDGMVDVIALTVDRNEGSLRDINRIYSILYLCLASIGPNTVRNPPLIGGLILMKYYDPALFKKALTEKLVFSEVSDFFQFRENLKDYGSDQRDIAWLHQVWGVFLGGDGIDPETKQRIAGGLWKYHIEVDPSGVAMLAHNVVDRFWQQS